MAAQGIRINVVDLDGDGWPDLEVRFHGIVPDSFERDGQRRTWLLHNNGQGGFTDVTQSSGFRATRFSYADDLGRPGDVLASADVDNDGDLDIYSGLNNADPNLTVDETSEVMLNLGNGMFMFGLADNPIRCQDRDDVPAGASFVDFDRDGNIDLWVTQHIAPNARQPLQDRLWKGDGTGRFVEVTEQAGLVSADWTIDDLNAGLSHSLAWSGTACDLNGDGVTELMASSYGRAPNLLWQGVWDESGVTFINRSVASGYAYDHRQDWSDNLSAQCYCKLHRDAPGCADVPEPQHIRCESDSDVFRWNHLSDREPYRLGGNSGATICGDVNNDGYTDLLTTEIVHWDVGSSSDPAELLFNTGEADVRFERPGNEVTGLTRPHHGVDWNDGDMTGVIFDFDNDGWPDVYIGASDYPGNYGLLFHQENPEQFELLSTDDYFEHNRSHGVVVADFDRDGDLDVVVGHSRSRCGEPNDCYETYQVRFFENIIGDSNNWIQLKLEGGEGTNRAAIGARVTVTADGVTQTQEVYGGHGHYGTQNDLVLHFGLGSACEAEVTVRWPDADLTAETFTLWAGARYHVVQGEDPVEVE